MAPSSTIAVNAAKSVFEVAVSTRPGRVAARHRLTRPQFTPFRGHASAGHRAHGGAQHRALLGPPGPGA
jgi:hypothetical protein